MVDVMKLPARNGEIWHGDCLELMRSVPTGSVDMILCDLPYGTTACSWDSVIPFEPLWSEYWRIAKPNAAVVLTASQPFTSALIMSQIDRFKYSWVWSKSKGSGFLNAKNAPVKMHEDVHVFSQGTTANKSDKRMNYFPQELIKVDRKRKQPNVCDSVGTRPSRQNDYIQEFQGYPSTILKFPNDGTRLHPTQKPVALFEYLIRTYTNPGDTVLDNCIGSGTTAIAAENTGRRWIGIEKDFDYFMKAWNRIVSHER